MSTFWARDTTPRSPQDIYARHLLSPRGYPLWMPDPSRQFLTYRRDGLRIGDVGVIIPETGGFDVYFNICLPHNHPFHQATGVPDNFEPIQLGAMDIRTATNVENPGRIIASSSVRTTRIVEQPGDTSSRTQPSGPEYEFNLSSSEGALLILPDGAECEDLRNHHLFLQAAAQHGADWYRFAEEKVGQIIGHDSLYLITGFHKTFSWSLAAFEETAGNAEYLARCRLPQLRGNITTAGTWDTTRVLHHWRVGPDEYLGIPNQAPFIRGFKVTRRTRVFGRRISVETDVPSTRSSRVNYFGAVRRGTWWRSIFGGQSGDKEIGSSTSNMQDEIVADSENEIQNHGALAVGEDIVIHRMSQASQAFHPSDIINQYLLKKVPSANIAITHDNEWIALLEKNMIRSEDLVQESLLEGLVSNNYHVISEAGAVYLRSNDPDTSNNSEVSATTGAQNSNSDNMATAIVDETPSAELGDVTALYVPQNIPRVDHYSFSSNDNQDAVVTMTQGRAGDTVPTARAALNKAITMLTAQEYDISQIAANQVEATRVSQELTQLPPSTATSKGQPASHTVVAEPVAIRPWGVASAPSLSINEGGSAGQASTSTPLASGLDASTKEGMNAIFTVESDISVAASPPLTLTTKSAWTSMNLRFMRIEPVPEPENDLMGWTLLATEAEERSVSRLFGSSNSRYWDDIIAGKSEENEAEAAPRTHDKARQRCSWKDELMPMDTPCLEAREEWHATPFEASQCNVGVWEQGMKRSWWASWAMKALQDQPFHRIPERHK